MTAFATKKYLLLERFYVGRWMTHRLLMDVYAYAEQHDAWNKTIDKEYTFQSAITFLNYTYKNVFSEESLHNIEHMTEAIVRRATGFDLDTYVCQMDQHWRTMEEVAGKFNARFRDSN